MTFFKDIYTLEVSTILYVYCCAVPVLWETKILIFVRTSKICNQLSQAKDLTWQNVNITFLALFKTTYQLLYKMKIAFNRS